MTQTGSPYTQEQLKAAFDAVSNPDDWKAPVFASMGGESVNVVVAAIRHFTATDPEVVLDVGTMRWVVSSIGYRAGPAGDH